MRTEELEIQEIYKQLCIHNVILIDIYKTDIPKLRKNMSALKSREAAKLKQNDIMPDNRKLEFIEMESKHADTSIVTLQIELKEPVTISIVGKIRILENELIGKPEKEC